MVQLVLCLFNTDFVTWIVIFYQLMLVVTGVMHEADNAYSIWSTWLCYQNKSFFNCANLRSMHNCVENCIFFNICAENHLKLSLIWFLFVYFNIILILDLINHV